MPGRYAGDVSWLDTAGRLPVVALIIVTGIVPGGLLRLLQNVL
jgi:hypothetical protein